MARHGVSSQFGAIAAQAWYRIALFVYLGEADCDCGMVKAVPQEVAERPRARWLEEGRGLFAETAAHFE